MAELLQMWQDVAQVLGAELDYTDNRTDKTRLEEITLRVSHRRRTIRFYSRSSSTGKRSPKSDTNIRCEVRNPQQFYFNIYEQRLKHRLFKVIGLQDIPIGDPDLNRRFIVQASHEAYIRQLLNLPLVRAGFASPFIQHLSLSGNLETEAGASLLDHCQLYGKTEQPLSAQGEILAHFQLFAATLDGLADLALIPE